MVTATAASGLGTLINFTSRSILNDILLFFCRVAYITFVAIYGAQ